MRISRSDSNCVSLPLLFLRLSVVAGIPMMLRDFPLRHAEHANQILQGRRMATRRAPSSAPLRCRWESGSAEYCAGRTQAHRVGWCSAHRVRHCRRTSRIPLHGPHGAVRRVDRHAPASTPECSLGASSTTSLSIRALPNYHMGHRSPSMPVPQFPASIPPGAASRRQHPRPRWGCGAGVRTLATNQSRMSPELRLSMWKYLRRIVPLPYVERSIRTSSPSCLAAAMTSSWVRPCSLTRSSER